MIIKKGSMAIDSQFPLILCMVCEANISSSSKFAVYNTMPLALALM